MFHARQNAVRVRPVDIHHPNVLPVRATRKAEAKGELSSLRIPGWELGIKT
jgi:hypothetical protein